MNKELNMIGRFGNVELKFRCVEFDVLLEHLIGDT